MNPDLTAADDVLSRHGRSFHLAARFLPARIRERATCLYAFCRELDDLADLTANPAAANAKLMEVRRVLHQSDQPVCRIYRSLHLADGQPADALLMALAKDTGPGQMSSADELLRYSHGVAGTVGLMMSEILGATCPAARSHALDLGIAMQLVNICRDVREDARRSRIYLPMEWLPPGVTAETLTADPRPAWPTVQKCLQLAEEYFISGFAGLSYLPRESRRGIWLAGRIYREIGQEILRRGSDAMLHRTVVPNWRRFAVALRCLLSPSPPFAKSGSSGHEARLHLALSGLCGHHATS